MVVIQELFNKHCFSNYMLDYTKNWWEASRQNLNLKVLKQVYLDIQNSCHGIPFGIVRHNSKSIHGSGVCKEHYV